MDFTRLPAPDTHGNYYFGDKPACSDSPAIMPFLATTGARTKYMLSLGEEGMVWEREAGVLRLKVYRNAGEALRELRRRMRQ